MEHSPRNQLNKHTLRRTWSTRFSLSTEELKPHGCLQRQSALTQVVYTHRLPTEGASFHTHFPRKVVLPQSSAAHEHATHRGHRTPVEVAKEKHSFAHSCVHISLVLVCYIDFSCVGPNMHCKGLLEPRRSNSAHHHIMAHVCVHISLVSLCHIDLTLVGPNMRCKNHLSSGSKTKFTTIRRAASRSAMV